jgi:hypothetical protein
MRVLFTLALMLHAAAQPKKEQHDRKHGDPCKNEHGSFGQPGTPPDPFRAKMQKLCDALPYVEHQRHPKYKKANMDIIDLQEDWIEAQEDGRSQAYDSKYKHRVLGELLARAIRAALPAYQAHVPAIKLAPLAMRRAASWRPHPPSSGRHAPPPLRACAAPPRPLRAAPPPAAPSSPSALYRVAGAKSTCCNAAFTPPAPKRPPITAMAASFDARCLSAKEYLSFSAAGGGGSVFVSERRAPRRAQGADIVQNSCALRDDASGRVVRVEKFCDQGIPVLKNFS